MLTGIVFAIVTGTTAFAATPPAPSGAPADVCKRLLTEVLEKETVKASTRENLQKSTLLAFAAKVQAPELYHRARAHYTNADGLRFFSNSLTKLDDAQLRNLSIMFSKDPEAVDQMIDYLNKNFAVENPNWFFTKDILQFMSSMKSQVSGAVYGAAIGSLFGLTPIGAAIGYAASGSPKEKSQKTGETMVTVTSLSYPDDPKLNPFANYPIVQQDASEAYLRAELSNNEKKLLLGQLVAAGINLVDPEVIAVLKTHYNNDEIYQYALDSAQFSGLDAFATIFQKYWWATSGRVATRMGKANLKNRWSYFTYSFNLPNKTSAQRIKGDFAPFIAGIEKATSPEEVINVINEWFRVDLERSNAALSYVVKNDRQFRNAYDVINEIRSRGLPNLTLILQAIMHNDFESGRAYILQQIKKRQTDLLSQAGWPA